MVMEQLRQNVELLFAQKAALESKLEGFDKRLDAYQAELQEFMLGLRARYDYDALVSERAAAESELDDVKFNTYRYRAEMVIEALYRLVRADPDNAMQAVKGVCDDFPVDVRWNSNVKPELFEACFKVYVKCVSSDTYWEDFCASTWAESHDGEWCIEQPQDFSWRPCIAVAFQLSFLDDKLDAFLSEVEKRVQVGANTWARRFSAEYEADAAKRRALYETLRPEFENN